MGPANTGVGKSCLCPNQRCYSTIYYFIISYLNMTALLSISFFAMGNKNQ